MIVFLWITLLFFRCGIFFFFCEGCDQNMTGVTSCKLTILNSNFKENFKEMKTINILDNS